MLADTEKLIWQESQEIQELVNWKSILTENLIIQQEKIVDQRVLAPLNHPQIFLDRNPNSTLVPGQQIYEQT